MIMRVHEVVGLMCLFRRVRQMRSDDLQFAVAFNVGVCVARTVGFLLSVLHPFGNDDADEDDGIAI